MLFRKRGGKRRGAGRPPKGARAGSPHKTRPFLHARYPVHVTLRAIGAVGHLRRRCVYRAIREATLTTARREDFRIVHLSIQHNHVHPHDPSHLGTRSDVARIKASATGFGRQRNVIKRRGAKAPDRSRYCV